MDAINRLRFHIFQDEIRETWESFVVYMRSLWPRCHNKVGTTLGEISHESEGRVWVEVGGEGYRVRVIHFHPANPSVAEALERRCHERNFNLKDGDSIGIMGQMFDMPEDDDISLSSLEDYWFNHWQGPFITADNNQNSYGLSRLRRSHRKSKRKSRCSICQKKLVGVHIEDGNDIQCFEGEKDILAHVPSLKLDSKVIKDESEEKSDDEEISRLSVNEDALSRCSASDEQLARANRILDNELKMSLSLFADEAVVQDVVDGPSCNEAPTDSNIRYLIPSSPTPTSAYLSRSCPCSPKISRRTHSPGYNIDSPKSRSYLGISKFSLSSSLLAIHRQASSTFKPDFLRSDFRKSVPSSITSKRNSQHSSLKSEARKSARFISDSREQDSSKNEGPCPTSSSEELFTVSSTTSTSSLKTSISESQSLPTLKLSKMSLTYRGGVIISEESEQDSFPPVDYGEGACALKTDDPMKIIFEEDKPQKSLLPDVIPELEIPSNRKLPDDKEFLPAYYHLLSEVKGGVINLGFDGNGETSDFPDSKVISTTLSQNSPSDVRNATNPSITLDLPNSHGVSIGHVSEGKDYSFSVEPFSNSVNEDSPGGYEDSQKGKCMRHDSTISLRNWKEEETVTQPEPPPPIVFELEEEKDTMQEARDLVYWWRKRNSSSPQEEEEFCLHEIECKVKQKPLLFFLHGIGSSADVWTQQLWYFLSCGYEVVAPDLLGHGISSAPYDKDSYSFSNMLDYISLVFDLFVPQGRKCIIIAHNYGCSLAVALARGRPMSVNSIVLAGCGSPNPLVPYSNEESALSSSTNSFLQPFISCGCLSRELLYLPRGKHYSPVTCDTSRGITATPRYVLENTRLGQHWPEGDMAFHRRITIPSLLLHGMKDELVSLVEMCEMEKTIPRAFLELIPGAGHEIMTEASEKVCHAIHKFIKRWKRQI